MFKINAIGKACPLPVIEAHRALKEHDALEITVDNEIATQNLKKLAAATHCDYTCTKESDSHYTVRLLKQGSVVAEAPTPIVTTTDDYIVVINSPYMGVGVSPADEAFSKKLLQTFIYTLTEQDVLPQRIIFYNGGVPLVTADSDSLADLQRLKKAGVEIYACGACLNYYGLTEKVAVGSVTNMFHIIEMMRTANRIVRP